jgi:hypothetical protein
MTSLYAPASYTNRYSLGWLDLSPNAPALHLVVIVAPLTGLNRANTYSLLGRTVSVKTTRFNDPSSRRLPCIVPFNLSSSSRVRYRSDKQQTVEQLSSSIDTNLSTSKIDSLVCVLEATLALAPSPKKRTNAVSSKAREQIFARLPTARASDNHGDVFRRERRTQQ